MIRALVYLAIIAAVLGGYKAWEHRVYSAGYAARDIEAKAQAVDDTLSAQARERKLIADMNEQSQQRYAENADHEKTIDALRARARAGALRLSVAVDPGAHCYATNPAAAARSGEQARTDLMPSTTDAVLGIAADSARHVRDYNAVLDAYNRARATCNEVTR